jgi:ABC-type Fe3+/spermidine/putrescine transport system ATPase subunit
MTVANNLTFGLRSQRLSDHDIAQRLNHALDVTRLAPYRDRYPSELSGGQQQRVAIARCLAARPALMLFDEPLSNLDARLRDHLRVQLRELQTQLKITSVYVTHDQREALALADQIAVMQGGTILQIGDPISVYTRPKTSVIADFLGYSNIFDARLVERGAPFHLVAIGDSGLELKVAALGDESREGDAANLAGNRVPGEVVLASFMGSYIQYRVRVAGGTTWDVFSPDIAARARTGAKVVLEAAPEDILLLPSA